MSDWLQTEIIPPPFVRPLYESGMIYVENRLGDGGLSKRGFVPSGEYIHHLSRRWRAFVRRP